ncbi:MAG: hypothetical protein HGA22_11670, partial [Clostridiales bacterium]|nr:hypothetical protein [Clostridiales bacterium]
MNKRIYISLLAALSIIISVMFGTTCSAQTSYTDAEFNGSIILGRPDESKMTASIASGSSMQVFLEWGPGSGVYPSKSETFGASEANPAEIVMDGLEANHKYYYRLFFRESGAASFKNTAEYSFSTPKSPGSGYTFVVQSDSHLLNKADKELYLQSMKAAAGFKPDFLFDLGDTFLNDQVASPQYQDEERIKSTSFQQRSFFDIVTRNAPLFLTIGNHEGEYGKFLDGTNKNITVMSTLARKTWYPNPEPDGFYSGNTEAESFTGLPENYYAFT